MAALRRVLYGRRRVRHRRKFNRKLGDWNHLGLSIVAFIVWRSDQPSAGPIWWSSKRGFRSASSRPIAARRFFRSSAQFETCAPQTTPDRSGSSTRSVTFKLIGIALISFADGGWGNSGGVGLDCVWNASDCSTLLLWPERSRSLIHSER